MRSLNVALGIFATGKLGLMLAIPPGFATAIWPPAGIALAAAVIWGWRIWPGVFLGSALVNLATSANLNEDLTETLLTTLAIAAGSTAQALLGGKLTRRWLGETLQFHEELGAFKFILVAMISSLVACSAGVLTLLTAGLIPVSNAAFSWFTWWIGDSVGAVLVAPVMITVAQEKGAVNLRRLTQILIPFTAVLASAIGVYFLARSWEKERIRNEFQSMSQDVTDALRQNLDFAAHDLKSLESFFKSSQTVTRAEFETFATDVLGHDRFRAVGWTEYQRSPSGNLAADKAPVMYIEPREGFRESLGFDLLADKERRETLIWARDNGQAALTPPLHPRFDAAPEPIVILIQPVYANSRSTLSVEEKRRNIRGFIVGSLRLSHLMDLSFAAHRIEGIKLSVEEISPAGAVPVFVRQSKDAVTYEQTKVNHLPDYTFSQEISAGGKTWRLSFSATQEYLVGQRGWPAWLVLLFGLIFTSFAGLFLLVTSSQHTYVESLVRRRTEELSNLNRKMFAMAKMTSLGEMAGGVAHEINTPLAIIHMQAEMLKYLAQAGQCGTKEIIAGAENIERTVFRISTITKGLLSFAREGELDATEKIPLTRILADTRAMCEERLRNNGINLRIQEPSEDLHLQCRSTQITQILLNLLNNAFDATRATAQPVIQLEIRRHGEFVSVTVSDNGHGVPPDLREKIFEPFFTTKGIGSGVGLGLSISAGIAQSHGGTLTLHPSESTSFVLTLPVSA